MPRFRRRKFPKFITPKGHEKYAVDLVDKILSDYSISHLPTVIRPQLNVSYIKANEWGVITRLGRQHMLTILHEGFKERQDTKHIWHGLNLTGYSGLWANSLHQAAHALCYHRHQDGETHGPLFQECLQELFLNYSELWRDYAKK